MASDAKRADARARTSPQGSIPVSGHVASGVQDLRAQLKDARDALEALRKKYTALGDELEHATIRAVRADVELASAKGREAEGARQWLAMSADLSAARARATRHDRLLNCLTEKLSALRERARGSALEPEIDELLGLATQRLPSE